MILDATLVTIGMLLGTIATGLWLACIIHLARTINRTRLAWWIRSRHAIRRARPTRAGR